MFKFFSQRKENDITLTSDYHLTLNNLISSDLHTNSLYQAIERGARRNAKVGLKNSHISFYIDTLPVCL